MRARQIRMVSRAVAQARSSVVILMLHRFGSNPSDASVVDPQAFERDLLHLRRRGWTFSSLRDVVEALRQAEPLPPTIVVTVDDGYHDFVDLGVPALASAGCPATVFPTAGFLDGTCWFWWDQVAHVLENGRAGQVTVTIGGRTRTIQRSGITDSGVHIVEILKQVQDDELHRAIGHLAERHEVEIQATPPEQYRSTSWSALRAIAGEGFEVGPHTVTHPILSQVDDARARAELSDGWTRVQEEMGPSAVPVACYPNGKLTSFGDREVALAAACGLTAGVTATHQLAVNMRTAGADVFRIPRVGWHRQLVRLAEHPNRFGATYAAYSLAKRARSRMR